MNALSTNITIMGHIFSLWKKAHRNKNIFKNWSQKRLWPQITSSSTAFKNVVKRKRVFSLHTYYDY